jgi:hypothetical protein
VERFFAINELSRLTSSKVFDSTGVNNRRNRQNRNTGRNLLPDCYQKPAIPIMLYGADLDLFGRGGLFELLSEGTLAG